MASDREQPSGNSQDSQKENENLTQTTQSTDDYFENVNRRLKKKSRFGRGKSEKKESSPKKPTPPSEAKIIVPEASVEPVIEESPTKVITEEVVAEPVVESSPPTVEAVEEQAVTVEPEPISVEPEPATLDTPQAPTVEEVVVEPPPVVEKEPELVHVPVEDSIYSTIPEITVEPKKAEEAKPKKKGLFGFGFLRRLKKEPKIQTSRGAQKESLAVLPEVTLDEQGASQDLAAIKAESQMVTESVAVEEFPVNPVEKLQVESSEADLKHVNAQVPFFDGIVHIGKFTKEDTSRFAQKAVLSIGEYPVHLLLRSRFASKPDGVLPLFIDRASQDIIKESSNQVNPDYIVGLDSELDTHFWFNILPNVSKDSPFFEKLQSKPLGQLRSALIVASIWDGVGSALLPTITTEFNERKISSASLAMFPSKVQSLENQFNAFVAVGKCAIANSGPVVLLDRDIIENYLGVDRKGNMIKGNTIVNYLVDLILSKETLVDEFNELSKTFDSNVFTLMFGTGASLKLYGSIENILDTLLFKQFLPIDLSSAELIYVLTRAPYSLKEKVDRAKIEMATANWFKDKATLKSIHVAEPVYIEDHNDRIDIALFIGGFDTTKMFGAIEKKVTTMKNRAVKKGLLQEDEWKEIVKKLTT